MFYLLRLLGFVWTLPATIVVWLFYIIPFWAGGALRYDGSPSFLVARFVLTGQCGWYYRAWNDWTGWAGPCVMILRTSRPYCDQLLSALSDSDPWLAHRERWHRIVDHELRHCAQQFLFGVFYYPVYVLLSMAIYLFLSHLHPYFDNPFEVDARRAAGQPERILSKDHSDRWLWW